MNLEVFFRLVVDWHSQWSVICFSNVVKYILEMCANKVNDKIII